MSNEYGNEKSLQEILEDLAVYCALNMADSNGIRVILPQKAIDAHNAAFFKKQPIVLTGEAIVSKEQPPKDESKWTSGGCIYIHSIEDNQKLLKELV